MKNERTGVYAQVTEQYTQEEYEHWRRVIRQPENPIQTENTELREWIREMCIRDSYQVKCGSTNNFMKSPQIIYEFASKRESSAVKQQLPPV